MQGMQKRANLVPTAFSRNEVVGALPSQILSAFIFIVQQQHILFFHNVVFFSTVAVTCQLSLFQEISEKKRAHLIQYKYTLFDLVKTGSADPAYDSVKLDQSRRKDTSIAICLSFYFCSDFDSLIFTRSQATERKRSDSCHSICTEILPLRRQLSANPLSVKRAMRRTNYFIYT